MNEKMIQKNEVPQVPAEVMEQVLAYRNTSRLTPAQKIGVINALCHSLGLNPITQPFDFMQTRDGREIPYARKDCTDQLRRLYNVSIRIIKREVRDGIYVVAAAAQMPNGRVDEAEGAVNIEGLKGEARANAVMKAETKAKRRVTLSICGLGFLDESEIDSLTAPSFSKSAEINERIALESKPETQEQPAPSPIDDLIFEEPETSLGDYVVKFGKKLKGMALKDIKEDELFNYLQWVMGEQDKSQKPAHPDVAEFIEHANAYLKEVKQS